MMMRIKAARFFYVALGISVIAWWWGLFASAEFRGYFFAKELAESGGFRMFIIADVALLGLVPLAISAIRMDSRWRNWLCGMAWLVLGAALYATLCCLYLWWVNHVTLLSLLSMIGASAGSFLSAKTFDEADEPASGN